MYISRSHSFWSSWSVPNVLFFLPSPDLSPFPFPSLIRIHSLLSVLKNWSIAHFYICWFDGLHCCLCHCCLLHPFPPLLFLLLLHSPKSGLVWSSQPTSGFRLEKSNLLAGWAALVTTWLAGMTNAHHWFLLWWERIIVVLGYERVILKPDIKYECS